MRSMKKKLLTEAGTMRLVTTIVSAFADSVAEGDFEAAEGWFSLARDHAGREAPSRDPDDKDRYP